MIISANNMIPLQGVSLVIATYNGKKRLKETLRHIAKQKEVNFELEVLLVDNKSTDGTALYAYEIWNEYGNPFEFRVILEMKPGTMFAREKGIEESKYRYILYCDDDNWLCQNYVYQAFKVITSDNSIAAVGGKGIMAYEDNFEPPKWIGSYERNFGTSPQGKQDGDTTFDKGCLYTAGTILDKIWLDKLYTSGFISSLKGRIGKSLLGGEDTELTYALKLIGGKLYYSSKMSFKHYMPSNRINWDYLKRLWRSFGYSNFIISPYNYYFNQFKYPKRSILLYWNLKSLVKLYSIKLLNRKGEGDGTDLEIQKIVGQLTAILFDFKRFQQNIEMVHILTKNISK